MRRPPGPRRCHRRLLALMSLGLWLGTASTLAMASPLDDALPALEQRFNVVAAPQASPEVRIQALEQLIFGQPGSGDLSTRLSRLQQVLPPLSPVVAGPAPSAAAAPLAPPRRPDATDYPSVTRLERELFGRDFKKEDLTQRLARLEERRFGRVMAALPLIDRVDRLTQGDFSAASPPPTSPPVVSSWTGQPLGQHVQPPVFGAGQTRTHPRPMVRMGSSMHGTSSSSHHPFSPELMEMLPPDIQAQMNGSGSQSFTAIQTPPRQTVIQQVNPWTGAATQSFSQQQSTWVTPNGSGPVSIQERTEIIPSVTTVVPGWGSFPGSLPPGGVPGFGASAMPGLDALEAAVSGRVMPDVPVPQRLSLLESRLLGQTYPGLDPWTRLNQLQRTASGGFQPGGSRMGRWGAVLNTLLNPYGGYGYGYGYPGYGGYGQAFGSTLGTGMFPGAGFQTVGPLGGAPLLGPGLRRF